MASPALRIRRLAPADATGVPSPQSRSIRGSRCRTSQELFTEWSVGLEFPGYFGHNWDAFRDCLRDVGSRSGAQAVPSTIVVRDAGDLLVDDGPHALSVLLTVLAEITGGDASDPCLLLVDDTSDRLFSLVQRGADAGYRIIM